MSIESRWVPEGNLVLNLDVGRDKASVVGCCVPGEGSHSGSES
jgi:hypothetical protein